MVKACIFDLDGVIVDTARYHFLAWRRLAREMGFDLSKSENERLKGVSRMASLDILLEIGKIELSEEEKSIKADLKNLWFVDFILTMSPNDILPGVSNFLNRLTDEGISIGLGSASKNAKTILKQIELTNRFSAVIDGNLVSTAKPDPEVFLKASEALQMVPEECVVFEDAIAGIEAAHRAGMKCIGVGDPSILRKADRVIPGFEGVGTDILIFR